MTGLRRGRIYPTRNVDKRGLDPPTGSLRSKPSFDTESQDEVQGRRQDSEQDRTRNRALIIASTIITVISLNAILP